MSVTGGGIKITIFNTQGEIEMTAYLPGPDAMKGYSYKSQRTVAIIEDERDIVDIYSCICALKGLKISFIAYDGFDALELFKNAVCPDIILIDHRMPNMTGLEAMKKMLDIDPEARFVFLSADEEVREQALKAGAKAFLKKPASINEIYDMIIKVLGMP
jgi:two-component system chemotaxis response regulator CheY